jgi:transcription initiation factor TFIIIB Brf1 subunit/transcription initiation factor TFIIB
MSAHTITATKASEPGALDGFQWVCGECGCVVRYSLRGMVEQEARSHGDWHARKRAGR